MDQFARTIIGYHGCTRELARRLLLGETRVSDWEPSTNAYDWLGHGIYFWEHGPSRAREWATSKYGVADADVIGALIQLNNCLDLADTAAVPLLQASYQALQRTYQAEGKALPQNSGDTDSVRRELDCEVINLLVELSAESDPIQTVRGVFTEGNPVFTGSKILEKSHVQVSVIDPACILGVFRPSS